jgi:hypothetical protein
MTTAPRPAGQRQSATQQGPARCSPQQVAWVRERLSQRDWQVLEAVNRLRILTGAQIERLFFDDLPSACSRTVSRTRVLRRLVSWRTLLPLGRRIGGSAHGSTVTIYGLDSTGQLLIRHRQATDGQPERVRRPIATGPRTQAHTLAVSELFVALTEQARRHRFHLADYQAEPSCWWTTGTGGHLKPDAYVRLELGPVIDHWWIEHDEATESLPTLRRKLLAYLDFVNRGQLGPGGVQPRVLLSTISEARCVALMQLARSLPEPAAHLFAATEAVHAAAYLYRSLRE